jgi:hypothetical protein
LKKKEKTIEVIIRLCYIGSNFRLSL